MWRVFAKKGTLKICQKEQILYRARLTGGAQVVWMLQARPGRSDEQQQQQCSPNLGTAFFSRSLYVAPCIRWPRILLYCICCIPFELAFEKKPMKSGRSSEWIAECERHWIEAAHIILDVIFAINCRELSLVRFMRRIRVEGPVSYNTRRCKELPRLLNYDVHGDIKEAERCV